ncbi:MAG: GntR family transcriptional regulator [Pseudomonadota bacterium]
MAEVESIVGEVVRPRRRETLAETVCREIEDLIVTGEIGAGEKLNELALANRLAVSRGTVREAVRHMAQSGLIELVSNRGAFVRRISNDEVNDLYELRGAIFALACARAARHQAACPEASLIAALQDNLEAMRAAHAEGDKDAYYRLNIGFHELLMDASANPRARAIYDGLVKEMHLYRRRGLSFATNIARSIEEHAAIAGAVAAGNEAAARDAGRVHIERGKARFFATRKEDG